MRCTTLDGAAMPARHRATLTVRVSARVETLTSGDGPIQMPAQRMGAILSYVRSSMVLVSGTRSSARQAITQCFVGRESVFGQKPKAASRSGRNFSTNSAAARHGGAIVRISAALRSGVEGRGSRRPALPARIDCLSSASVLRHKNSANHQGPEHRRLTRMPPLPEGGAAKGEIVRGRGQSVRSGRGGLGALAINGDSHSQIVGIATVGCWHTFDLLADFSQARYFRNPGISCRS